MNTYPDPLLKAKLKKLYQEAGTWRKAGKVLDVSASYLNRLYNGERIEPSSSLLKKMGLKRITILANDV